MDNLKGVLTIFGASLALVILMAMGLSKLSNGGGETKVPPEELVADSRWEKTTGETKVTVVEFSDIQCPACKASEPIANELRMTGGVRFVYHHFPLVTIHKNAWKGARALEAAKMENKGWEMMSLMFDKQEEWSDLGNPDNKFVEYAKMVGLDEKEFEEKYKGKETDEAVGSDTALGNRLKLSGTPTFFVNGEQVASTYVLAKVRDLLKQ